MLAGLLLLAATSAPNVVLVTIDTLRADRVGAYGYAAGETPTIDRLAREGVLVEDAVVQVPQTRPSHASIFTGRYPYEHGIRDNYSKPLAPGTPTVASVLRQRGWDTAAFIGAYPVSRPLRPRPGIRRLRRPLRGGRRHHAPGPHGAAREGGGRPRARVAGEAPLRLLLRLGPPLRSPRALRAARALPEAPRREPLRRGGRVRRRPGRPASRLARRERCAGAHPRRRHLRPRRGPRGARRGRAHALRLRLDAARCPSSSPGPAVCRRGRACAGSSAASTSSPRSSISSRSRPRRRAGPRGPPPCRRAGGSPRTSPTRRACTPSSTSATHRCGRCAGTGGSSSTSPAPSSTGSPTTPTRRGTSSTRGPRSPPRCGRASGGSTGTRTRSRRCLRWTRRRPSAWPPWATSGAGPPRAARPREST